MVEGSGTSSVLVFKGPWGFDADIAFEWGYTNVNEQHGMCKGARATIHFDVNVIWDNGFSNTQRRIPHTSGG